MKAIGSLAGYMLVALAAANDASISPTTNSIATRKILDLSSIDTQGDPELDEWLQANTRMSPEALATCPGRCTSDANTTDWFLISDLQQLAACNETMLVNVVVQTSDKSPLRACTAIYDSGTKAAPVPAADRAALCPTPNHDMITARVHMASGFPKDVQVRYEIENSFSMDHALAAIQQIQLHISQQTPSCEHNTIQFGYSQSAAIGVFSGAEHHQHGLTFEVLQRVAELVQANHISQTTIFQLCIKDDLGSDYTLGVVVTSSDNLIVAKNTVAIWANGRCASGLDGEAVMEVTARIPIAKQRINGTISNLQNSTASHSAKRNLGSSLFTLTRRGDCKTATVKGGDGCMAVAQRCGISQDDLKRYNPADNFCNTLVVDQQVCCSSGTLPSSIPPANSDGSCVTRVVQEGDGCPTLPEKCGLSVNDFMTINTKPNLCNSFAAGQQVCCSYGTLPDRRPKPEADGTCASVKVVEGLDCAKIAASRDLTVNDIERFNKNTWGWNGCAIVWRDFRLCVSEGSPPMPEPVANAVCGPTVPGTQKPDKGTLLKDLNPCPLKACCNVWGQCGLTDDFCIESPSKTGAPGTSSLANGCVSNCGRELVKGSPPETKINIAYFEGFNANRPCLHMNPSDIDTSKYTHVHFAFAEITIDYKVDISKVQAQFDNFKALSGVKKIISFGGWDFSALPGTFNILREAVKPNNRDTFKNNIVAFVNANGLDGADLDWEYPGAPDIPDIPSDDPRNGINYYIFLTSLKNALGKDKSVSFAAPSSYWYMRAYPVTAMARTIDYIVFMTYDLHGQWDYGNKWTSPGCPTGNCLRSHVNDTETKDSLIMITKAGVPNNKVVVGVASYGRSFKMEQAGCDGPACKFTGSARESNAAKGRCTDTAGYISNAEIQEIIKSGKVNRQWEEAGSNLLVYSDTEWVSYMNDDTKAKRAAFYNDYNFAGTTDWAVDLQNFVDGSGNGSDDGEDDSERTYESDLSDCTDLVYSIEDLENKADNIPQECMDKYITSVQSTVMEDALKRYDDLVSNRYDHWFSVYAGYVRDEVPLQVDQFMASDDVNKYFKCVVVGKPPCCGSCRFFCQEDPAIGHCDKLNLDGCVCFPGCDANKIMEREVKCPKQTQQLEPLDHGYLANVTYVVTDKEGFLQAISDKYGIDGDWVKFGKKLMKAPASCVGRDINNCINNSGSFYYGYPNTPFSDIHVYDPKEMIEKSHSSLIDLRDKYRLLAEFGEYDLDMPWEDAVDGMILPAFSIKSAIDNMQNIVDEGKKIEERDRKEFILDMLLGVLFWIPFVGEIAGASGLVAVRTLSRLIGEVSNAAMTIYDIVHDPTNAFNAVFGYMLGTALDFTSLGKAAISKRSILGDDLNKLKGIKDSMDRIDKVRNNCLCK